MKRYYMRDSKRESNMVVGFVHFYGLGDNVCALKALYCIKHIYKAKLIVFGNKCMKEILQYCDFVDECVDIIEKGGVAHTEIINSYHCDYIVLTNPRRVFLRPLEKSNAKVIITPIKLASLFSKQCKSALIPSVGKYIKMSSEEMHCALVRRINPRLYDKQYPTLDFRNLTIRTDTKHKEYIDSFLSPYIKDCNRAYIIMINPFNIGNPYNLSLAGWLRLIQEFCKISDIQVLVVTYPQVHKDFMQELADSKLQSKNLIVFANNNDLLNLVEITKRVKLLISPSTGTTHLASILHIPTIGLYDKRDISRWGTSYCKRYIILKKPLQKMLPQDEDSAITQTLQAFQELKSGI